MEPLEFIIWVIVFVTPIVILGATIDYIRRYRQRFVEPACEHQHTVTRMDWYVTSKVCANCGEVLARYQTEDI